MIIAALVDLGVPERVIEDAVARASARRFPSALRDARAERDRRHVVRRARRRAAARADVGPIRKLLDEVEARRRGRGARRRHVRAARRVRGEGSSHADRRRALPRGRGDRRDRRCRRERGGARISRRRVVVSPLPMGHGRIEGAPRHPPAAAAGGRRVPAGHPDVRRRDRVRVRHADGRGDRRRAREGLDALAFDEAGAHGVGRGDRRPCRSTEPPPRRAR